MPKKNRLTIFILLAMVAGILVGYLMNQYGNGSQVTYSPAKDYTGTDHIVLNLSGSKTNQPIVVVKDSSAYKRVSDSLGKDYWVVLTNSSKSYTASAFIKGTDAHLKGIAEMPGHGSATITSIQSFSDTIKLLTTIFLRLVQMIIAPL